MPHASARCQVCTCHIFVWHVQTWHRRGRRGGARAHPARRRRDRGDGQRGAGRPDRRARGASRAPGRGAHPPDARAAPAPLDRGAVRRPPAARLLLPLAGDAAVLLGRHLRPGAEPLLRDAAPAAGRDEVLARAGGDEPARPARLLQPRHQRRVRRGADRARPVLRRGQPPHAAHPGPQPGPCLPAARLVRARRAARRDPAAVPDERDRAIAERIVERIPDGATLQVGIGAIPNAVLPRSAGIATSASTPSCCPTGSSTWSTGRGDGHAQVPAAEQGRHHVRARHHRALRVDAREQRGRAAARRLRQQPAHGRARARLRLDQRDDGGGPVRPVRIGDDGRPLLVLERRPGRLRARRDVLGRRSGVHRAALDDAHRDQPDPRPPHRGLGRDDAEEHRRPRRDGMGRGEAARALDRGAGARARRDRAPRPPRRAGGEARAVGIWGAR